MKTCCDEQYSEIRSCEELASLEHLISLLVSFYGPFLVGCLEDSILQVIFVFKRLKDYDVGSSLVLNLQHWKASLLDGSLKTQWSRFIPISASCYCLGCGEFSEGYMGLLFLWLELSVMVNHSFCSLMFGMIWGWRLDLLCYSTT